MGTVHALEGYDPAVIKMALACPEKAPKELWDAIIKAAQDVFAFSPSRKARQIVVEVSRRVPDKMKLAEDRVPTLAEIITYVAGKHRVAIEDLKSPRRTRKLVRPRQEFYYLARQRTPFSYPDIAEFCGGRDHSTVFDGARKFAQDNNLPLPHSNHGVKQCRIA
ncbi:helix-turn-helix domain-containing protein [Roseibium sp.]|uniref:helix-turn-helix domain-containing protein n=1 Tax=Roseibium sp. TaxID=1936156 RepID=UPI003B523316